MNDKRFRLWINKDGIPVAVELLGVDLTSELAAQLADQLEVARANGKVMILASDWEVRSA